MYKKIMFLALFCQIVSNANIILQDTPIKIEYYNNHNKNKKSNENIENTNKTKKTNEKTFITIKKKKKYTPLTSNNKIYIHNGKKKDYYISNKINYEKYDKYKYLENNKVLYTEYGIASYYGEKWNGRKTANGEIYNTYGFSVAHKNLPFGSIIKITNLENKKTIILRVNDRGPYIKNRIVDLSVSAFRQVESLDKGLFKVKIEVLKYGK